MTYRRLIHIVLMNDLPFVSLFQTAKPPGGCPGDEVMGSRKGRRIQQPPGLLGCLVFVFFALAPVSTQHANTYHYTKSSDQELA